MTNLVSELHRKARSGNEPVAHAMKTHRVQGTLLLALTILMGAVQIGNAQIGSGWTTLPLDKAHAFFGGSYSISNDVETFNLPSGANRMEMRLKPDYGSGQRQFQGDVKVPGDVRTQGASITQVYEHGIGQEHQIRIDPSGMMYTRPRLVRL